MFVPFLVEKKYNENSKEKKRVKLGINITHPWCLKKLT